MPIPPEPSREHPSTYFMPDRSNEEELNRLRLQVSDGLAVFA